ncbi:MAG: hypothetical protein H7Z37_18815 [Pyrinomonadaceae bacterium]|nr:hypothetical protein [Pyrinomonadaceae bacterium]
MTDKSITFPRIERERRFLLEGLPAPLTRASEHLQFFDNYLTETRLFLSQIRVPKTKEWTRRFVQKFPTQIDENTLDLSRLTISEIELNAYEYEVLAVFEGNELRYNRYFHETNAQIITIDLYIGDLWGLILATATFETDEAMQKFTIPDFVYSEVTQDEFFTGANLSNLKFADVQNHLRIVKS